MRITRCRTNFGLRGKSGVLRCPAGTAGTAGLLDPSQTIDRFAAYSYYVRVGDSNRLLAPDRAAVERTARDLVLGVVEGRTPAGVSVAVEGAPGIGKTFLVREILARVAPGAAKVLRVAGQPGRRNDPFAVAGQSRVTEPGYRSG